MNATDPARELARLLDTLSIESGEAAYIFLARQFGVGAWSREFFEIVFSIVDRCNFLINIVQDLDLEKELKDGAVTAILTVQSAFNVSEFQNVWNVVGKGRLNPGNITAIKYVSLAVREKVSYVLISDVEKEELISEIRGLVEWLDRHQLNEDDFIRSALIKGLNIFLIRLEKMSFFGWSYTISSLRDVFSAYIMLEQGRPSQADGDIWEAMYIKVSSGLKDISSKVGAAKDLVERADFALKAYGFVTLCVQGKETIAGLLPHLT